MKTSLGPRIRIALASLLFGAIAVTAWSCACSTAAHGTMAASGGTNTTTDDSMGLGSNVGSEVGSAAETGSDEGSGTGTGSGSAEQSAAPGRGEQCGANDACGDGLTCLKYYGVAGPRGPQLDSCETPCKDNPNVCTNGTKCVKIADGPGDVCR